MYLKFIVYSLDIYCYWVFFLYKFVFYIIYVRDINIDMLIFIIMLIVMYIFLMEK